MNIKLSDKRQNNLWLDRDIRFDVNSKELQIKDSEKKIRTFFSIEDTKGKPINLFDLKLIRTIANFICS